MSGRVTKKTKWANEDGAAVFALNDKFTVTGRQLAMIIDSVQTMSSGGRNECPPWTYINTNRILDTVMWITGFEEGPPKY